MTLDHEVCQNLIDKYALGKVLNIKHLTKGFTNTNFKVKTEKGNVLFRIFLEKTIEQINYEMGLLKALDRNQISVAMPMLNHENSYINHTPAGTVVLYEYIKGKEPKPSKKVNKRIAKVVAKLNSLEPDPAFDRPNPIGLPRCKALIKALPDATYQFPDFFEYLIEQTEYLEEALTTDLPKGLIHGDVFADNTKFKKKKFLALLDFEEASTDSLLIDVGVTINGFCFKENQLDFKLFKAFLLSYHKHRPLTAEEIRLIPYFIQWGAHSMIYWHISLLIDEGPSRRVDRVAYLIERVRGLRKGQQELEKFISMIL